MKLSMTFLLGILFLLPGLALSQDSQYDGDYPEYLGPEDRVELLWAQYLDQSLEVLRFHSENSALQKSQIDLRQRLKLMEMKASFESLGKRSPFKESVALDSLSPKDALYFASEMGNYQHINFRFKEEAARALKVAKAKIRRASKASRRTKEEIEDLVFEGADLATYEGGKYAEGIKLFLFCRSDRNYPCLFVMKDRFDSLVRNADGRLWTLPALAKSASNRPFNVTNGHTPQGVHTIDSVMPEANRQGAFGKFRRMILNWAPSDELTKDLLPASALNKNWWSQASIARDNGRKWLRIHGTGRTNTDPQSSYYPHRPTNGCISTREGAYPEQTYIDQRVILDKAMEAMRMSPVYDNEVRIKGVLYVIDLNSKSERVTEAALKNFGIF